MNTDIPEFLYHYCSPEAGLNILRSSTLWLSDITHSNDLKEITWALDIIEQQFNVFIEDHFPSPPSDFKRIHISNIHRTFFNYLACCFSEQKDMLSQWRGYSSDAQGLCIGFKTEKLRSFFFAFPNALSELNRGLQFFEFRRILYSKDGFAEFVQKSLIDMCNKHGSNALAQLPSTLYRLTSLAPFVKNPGFREEQEWRILSPQIPLNAPAWQTVFDSAQDIVDLHKGDGSFLEFSLSRTLFRSKTDDIIPYKELSFPKDMISEIIIGPKCQVSEQNLQLLLAVNGYPYEDIKISHAQATYR